MSEDAQLRALYDLRARVHRVRFSKKVDFRVWEATWRAKERWERRWLRWSIDLQADLLTRSDIDAGVIAAMKTQKSRRFRKASNDDRQQQLIDDLIGRVSSGVDQTAWVNGAATSYIRMALDTGETAGQFSLDTLGINKTFAWANPRNMGRDLYSVRGSKIVANMYDNHFSTLAQMIVDGTEPGSPQTIGEIVKQIREEWPNVTRYQAERIARTETAAVWENLNMNSMIANQVPGANVLVATGPSVGTITMPVCSTCSGIVKAGPWTPASRAPRPPFHPNCRCTLVAELEYEDGRPWLPPADAWNGGEFADLMPLVDV